MVAADLEPEVGAPMHLCGALPCVLPPRSAGGGGVRGRGDCLKRDDHESCCGDPHEPDIAACEEEQEAAHEH